MESRQSITRDDTRYMVVRWSPDLGEQGWHNGAWGHCEDAVLMDHGAAADLAGALPGTKVMHEDEVFCCDGFDDDDDE